MTERKNEKENVLAKEQKEKGNGKEGELDDCGWKGVTETDKLVVVIIGVARTELPGTREDQPKVGADLNRVQKAWTRQGEQSCSMDRTAQSSSCV